MKNETKKLETAYLKEVIKVAAKIERNEYGDYINCSVAGAEFVTGHGSHTRLAGELRATEVIGWRKGRPVKRTGYIVTKKLIKLMTAYHAALASEEKAAKKAVLEKAARAAGFKTVSAYKKAEKAEKETRKAEALQHREQRFRQVVADVLDQRTYGYTVNDAVEMVLEKIDRREGVGRTYADGDFEGSDHAFVRCVLGAAHRHEHTDYDALLRSGYDREEALALREFTS